MFQIVILIHFLEDTECACAIVHEPTKAVNQRMTEHASLLSITERSRQK